jgi:hypothetical protein
VNAKASRLGLQRLAGQAGQIFREGEGREGDTDAPRCRPNSLLSPRGSGKIAPYLVGSKPVSQGGEAMAGRALSGSVVATLLLARFAAGDHRRYASQGTPDIFVVDTPCRHRWTPRPLPQPSRLSPVPTRARPAGRNDGCRSAHLVAKRLTPSSNGDGRRIGRRGGHAATGVACRAAAASARTTRRCPRRRRRGSPSP